ncbi:hypothetical protein FZEAL_7950 [Fusarium zealandicum]|uniref:Uncharacterized protein n=1 Tax=Fusarium zealandicum TaxID=1053134 RepID=A0A8H4UFK7_9HYPO|nr:hypothetical protein FZEAL_7950 [Fusarium zealandicum]
MHASKILASMGLLASASASVVRYAANHERDFAIEKRAAETAAWVTVDDEKQPAATYTPSMTVDDGTTKYVDGAPHDLTATVFTWTEYGKITTSTGEPPNPTASGKHGEGAFSRCHNKDGANAPFCTPAENSTLTQKVTYYVTWDPDYFNKTHDNTTTMVRTRLDLYNTTSEEYQNSDVEFDEVPAAFGFFPFEVKGDYLKFGGDYNISITLYSNVNNSAEKTKASTIYLNLEKEHDDHSHAPNVPNGHTLSIALPTVFGAIILLLVGGCIWNRKTRRIGLGNISSRNRHGYTGRAQRRMFGGRKDNGIQLDTRDMAPPSEYRDAPERPRRDSDGLGSLAGSPVDPSFAQQGTTGGRNAFRDEVRRQEQERHD